MMSRTLMLPETGALSSCDRADAEITRTCCKDGT